MKKILFSCILVLCTCLTYAQDKEAVLKLLETQRLDWNRGDIDGFMRGYWKSDSLLFVGREAPEYGWQSTIDRYKKAYPNKAAMGQLTFEVFQVRLIDANNAFIFGGWHLKLEKSAPGGYFTLWFRKMNGEWKIVVDHTS